ILSVSIRTSANAYRVWTLCEWGTRWRVPRLVPSSLPSGEDSPTSVAPSSSPTLTSAGFRFLKRRSIVALPPPSALCTVSPDLNARMQAHDRGKAFPRNKTIYLLYNSPLDLYIRLFEERPCRE